MFWLIEDDEGVEDEPKHSSKNEADKVVRNIKRQTCRKFNPEEKIRIVLAVFRGEESFAELCRQEGINRNLYYRTERGFGRKKSFNTVC